MKSELAISVVIPTHAPHFGRLGRTLAGLAAQTLPPEQWETLVVDNASPTPLTPETLPPQGPSNLRVIAEPILGLTAARLKGVREARGEILVFVDDDNVLDHMYLENVVEFFRRHPAVGAAGGVVAPEWEAPPPNWISPFLGLLALQDYGTFTRIAEGKAGAPWPPFAPVGAGLVVRRRLAEEYAGLLEQNPLRRSLDRQANRLSSGGDSDLVFTVLHRGADVAYEPSLRLTHLIPATRIDPAYLARLNRGIMRSWVRVLSLHGQCPWPPIPRWTVPLRVWRAWCRRRAWQSPASHIAWAGDRGQFEGQGDLNGATNGR